MFPSSVGRLIHNEGRAFIGIYPQGEDGWDTAEARDGSTSEAVHDDLRLVRAIVSKMESIGSTGRRYGWGSSNGAALCMKIAVNGGMGFHGVAAQVTALQMSPERYGFAPFEWNYPTEGSNTSSIGVLSIMASADGLIPIGGGPLFGSETTILAPAAESIGVWSRVNRCTGRSTESVSATYGGASTSTSTTATRTSYSGCEPVGRTEYFEVSCASHSGARTIDGVDATTYAVDFLLEIEAVCLGSADGCTERPVYSSPTVWPALTEPACRDTEASCVPCPPGFAAGDASSWAYPPAAPGIPCELEGSCVHDSCVPPSQSPVSCNLDASQASGDRCKCELTWTSGCEQPQGAQLSCV